MAIDACTSRSRARATSPARVYTSSPITRSMMALRSASVAAKKLRASSVAPKATEFTKLRKSCPIACSIAVCVIESRPSVTSEPSMNKRTRLPCVGCPS